MNEQEGSGGGSPITIVTGLPRSGTSMMMQMLLAGGMAVATDGLRHADEDNPRGYFELEAVKQLPTSTSVEWLEALRGRAVKMVFLLLYHLPLCFNYQVIVMHRELEEVLASQRMMLERRGRNWDDKDTELGAIYRRELAYFSAWLDKRREIRALHVNYEEVLDAPPSRAEEIREFLRLDLDTALMAEAVDRKLYRCRQGRTAVTN
jgi:hypothetical protein